MQSVFRISMPARSQLVQRFKVKSVVATYSTCRELDAADAEGGADILVANPYELDRAADDVIYALRMPRGGTGVAGAPVWLDLNIQAEGGSAGIYNCRAATTANVASLSGAATVDGETPTTGEKLLVWKQSTASQNGIYTYSSTGAWTKVASFAAGDSVLICTWAGTLYGKTLWTVSAASTVVGLGAYYL